MRVLTDGRPQGEMPGFYWSRSTEGPHKVHHGKKILSLFLLITKRETSIRAVIQLELPILTSTSFNMAPLANREYFRVRLHGFSVINLIALAIIVVCMMAGAESAREAKAVRTSKSSKEKVRLSVMRLYSTSVQQ